MAFVDLLVVLLLAGAGLFAVAQSRRAARIEGGAASASAENRRMADDIRELRARIHVLERALTDNHAGADLSQEIDRLRDR